MLVFAGHDLFKDLGQRPQMIVKAELLGRLQGPAAESTYLYQGVESWEVAPWFAKDPW